MSGNNGHAGDAPRPRLNLYAFRVVPVRFITKNQALIRKLLFGSAAKSNDVTFEINPVSGYVSYRHEKKLYREEERKNLALPPTEEAATLAAKTFLSERYKAFEACAPLQKTLAYTLTKGKKPERPFSVVPPSQWLKHAGTYLVKNDKHDQPDHWLCKFQVELETPGGQKFPVLNSTLDVRVGEAAGGSSNYEVVGFRSRWRPVYESYHVEQFLSDTGEPEHDEEKESEGGAGHVHFDELTLLTYVLSDENVPQFNLLPYEATAAGEHHLRILPASKDSLWVELNVKKVNGKYKVQALVMGGSGNYQAQWGFWDPYAYEFKDLEKKPLKG